MKSTFNNISFELKKKKQTFYYSNNNNNLFSILEFAWMQLNDLLRTTTSLSSC